MKRLIVCCDGTWNRADQVQDGVATPTNVVKLHRALADRDREGNPQVSRYLEGVGTRRWERLIGGGLGVGLSRNVQAAYRFLVDNYEPGDKLYVFGFSRGAFTARSTVGLVRNSGILRREHADRIEEAYRLYRSRKPGDTPRGDNAERFRDSYSHPSCEIQCVGVWDTVGALGIPIDGIRPPLLSKLWTFHDTTLSSYVRHAYHAVSIDERRGPFKPTLWVKKPEDRPPPPDAPQQTVEQVWFAGVHSDVGGGYPDPSLAEIPLRWMVEKATACGLAFRTDCLVLKREGFDTEKRCQGIELAPDPCGELHDSLSFLYRLMRRHDRRLRAHEGEAVEPWLASSARTRYDTDGKYRPLGWDEWAGHPDDMQVPS